MHIFPRALTPSILTRYIIGESAIFFLISLGIFTSVLFTLRLLKFASLVISKGVAAKQVLMVFVSIVPTFLEIAVPLATLLGVMLAFTRMSGDSELVVMRGSGISFYQMVKPVIIFGLFILLINLYISGFLKPWGYKKLSDTLLEVARSRSAAALESGVFNKLGGLTIYSDDIDGITGDLKRVLIEDRRVEDQPKLILAQNGTITSNPQERTVSLKLNDGVIHELLAGKYLLTRFERNTLQLDSGELLDTGGQKGRSPREMMGRELKTSIKDLKEIVKKTGESETVDSTNLSPLLQGQFSRPILTKKDLKRRLIRNQLEKYSRYSMPAASLILAIIAMTLGIQPSRMQRSWGAGLAAVAAIFVFIIYYASLSLGVTLAESGTISPLVASCFPNVVAALVAWFCFRQIVHERWHSVVEGLFIIAEKIKSLFQFKRKVRS